MGKQTNTLSKREITQTPHKDGRSHECRTKTTKSQIKQTKENSNLCENHLGKKMHRGDSRLKNNRNHLFLKQEEENPLEKS
jgi:hypothetical protein